MRVAGVFAAVAMGALLAGCEVVTGSTDGYTVQSNACESARDCETDAGAGICCLTVTGSTAIPLCQTAPVCPAVPGVQPVQLCVGSTECGDSPCLVQKCYWTTPAVTVRLCGAVPGCELALPLPDGGDAAGGGG